MYTIYTTRTIRCIFAVQIAVWVFALPALSSGGRIDPQPRGEASVQAPTNGQLLQGALKAAGAGTAAFKAALGHTRGVFDGAVNLLSVVRSKDNPNLTIASFSALQGGEPRAGLVISIYDPEGNSRFAVMYDAPEHLAKSLPAMLQRFDAATQEQLNGSRPASGDTALDLARFEAASQHVTLNRVQFPDKTASIGLAPGFKPIVMGGGKFTATAADGAFMTLFRPCNALDPKGSLYQSQVQLGRNIHQGPMKVPGQVVLAYDPDPVSAWKKYLVENARQNNAIDPQPRILKSEVIPGGNRDYPQVNIAGTMTVQGEPYLFTGRLVGSPLSAQGGWSVQVTLLQAPAAHAATDMPAMIAMQQSEKVDMNAVNRQAAQFIATINAQTTAWLRANKAAYDEASGQRFERSMANAHASRDAMDRSAAGFIRYINSTSVLQHGPTGAHSTMDANLAKALEQADPAHLSVVSPRDYIKGVDY